MAAAHPLAAVLAHARHLGHVARAAVDALRGVREIWEGALRPHTRDDAALQLVMLVSDGLYFNNALADGAGGFQGLALQAGAALGLLLLAVPINPWWGYPVTREDLGTGILLAFALPANASATYCKRKMPAATERLGEVTQVWEAE